MSNPLPEPMSDVLAVRWESGDTPSLHKHGTALISGIPTYTADQMREYAAAECVPLMNEIEALRQDGSRLTAERDQLRDYLRSAQTRANSYADERDRLKAELGDLPEAQAHLLTQLKDSRAYAERLKTRVDEVQAERDRLREELERWKARYEEVSKCD